MIPSINGSQLASGGEIRVSGGFNSLPGQQVGNRQTYSRNSAAQLHWDARRRYLQLEFRERMWASRDAGVTAIKFVMDFQTTVQDYYFGA